MWTYAVTCHADWIRLLAGRGMNICHEIWSLSTVIQPHTVYNKQKELLQSCYWKLKKNPIYGPDLVHWASDTTLVRWPILQREEFRSLISAMTIVKTLPRQVCQGAVGSCQKNKCVSVYDVATVIQIMYMTQVTSLLEHSSLAFHSRICHFISLLEGKFACGIIVVNVWNSTYVVMYSLVPLLIGLDWEGSCGYGIAVGCFMDLLLHSSTTTRGMPQPHRLSKAIAAALSAVILYIHGVANLYM